MRVKHVLVAIAAIVVAVGVSWWWVERGRSMTNMGEFVPPDEDVYIAQLVSSAVESINASTKNTIPPYRRDVHSKMHGCVQAEVKALPSLPASLRYGVFATPNKVYRSWIRYSSGNTDVQDDSEKDARGMALKLTGVGGPSLLDLETDAGTQDFIMINSPVFFIRNVAEYARFARLLADGSRFGYFFGLRNPFTWHLRDMLLALKTLKAAPASLLHEQYYSLTAYALGPSMNVKFSARACTAQPVAKVDRGKPDFLRDEMRAELGKDSACFDLMVQPQVPGQYMPIEDPTVEWKESDSPFVPVARITIPKQNFDTDQQKAFCENLSFSPWHALPDHRPLGGLNRVRRAVYLEDARYRRAKNGAIDEHGDYQPLREPRGWCLDLTGKPCPADAAAGGSTAQAGTSR
jgi:catalase